MTELTLIVSQFFLLFLIFSFPITPYINNFYLRKYNFDIYNVFCFNIIINLNIYLIISIFVSNIQVLFLINLGLAIIFLFLNIKKNIFFFRSLDWKLLFLFFFINISFFTALAEDPKLNWDGVVQWLPKATTYFQGLGFTDVGAHTYPHLGGFLWGYFWKNSILEMEYAGRFFYIFFYVLSVFSLINILKYKKKLNFLTITIFVIFIISITYDKFLFGGYQDTLLFSLIIIASNLLYLINIKKYQSFFIYFLFFLSAFICCWIKQEGLIYFTFLTLILILFEKGTKNKIVFFIFTLILLFTYFLLRNYLIGEIQFDQKLDFKIFKLLDFNFVNNILSSLIFNMIAAMLKYPIWLLILFFIFISLFAKKYLHEMRYIYFFLVLNLIFIFFIIFYSCLNLNFETCSLIMRVSMDRILYQSSGFYLVWIIYLFNNLKFFDSSRSYLG
tara:strand:+ start:341 stop:1672 length:1332 start_codon:yes stop_codon:yes gene_type:complete